MFYGNEKTRIVHYQQCRYGQRMKRDVSSRLREFRTFEEAKEQHYRRCKCCDPMLKPVRRIDSSAKRFCMDNSISYRQVKDELLITTPYSEWIVHVDVDRRFNLFHKNTLGNTKQYHLHGKQYSSVYAVFKYVYEHDCYREENPLPKRKKKKNPPKMGTKNCQAKMRKYKEQKRKSDIKNVLDLIESLSMA